jgi:hypothetical protein
VYSRRYNGTWVKRKIVKVSGKVVPDIVPMKTTKFEKLHGYSRAIAKEWGI